MDLGLQDKVALVTGSSRGLGLASAKALAAEGARVMLTARGVEQLARAADEVVALSSTDAVRTTAADLATGAGVEHAVAATVDAFGRLDIPHMRKKGGGVIIFITSIWGRESGGRMTYNAVKAAETSLAKSLAQQLARDNIRVVSVAPGSILFAGGSWHKRQQADPAGIDEFVRRDLPFGRFGRAEDVVAFLASPRASWVSGASIVVDGCQSKSNI